MANIDPCIKTSITCIHSKYLSIHSCMFVTCIKKLSLAYIIMLYSLPTCIGNMQFNSPIYSKKEGIVCHFPIKEKSCSFFYKTKRLIACSTILTKKYHHCFLKTIIFLSHQQLEALVALNYHFLLFFSHQDSSQLHH